MSPESAKEEEKEEKVKLDWLPLESAPAKFNEYFHSIGLKKDIYFKEML